MAQVICPECGARSSDNSTVCWKCDNPVDSTWGAAPTDTAGRFGRGLLIALGVIIVIVGICIALASGSF